MNGNERSKEEWLELKEEIHAHAMELKKMREEEAKGRYIRSLVRDLYRVDKEGFFVLD